MRTNSALPTERASLCLPRVVSGYDFVVEVKRPGFIAASRNGLTVVFKVIMSIWSGFVQGSLH